MSGMKASPQLTESLKAAAASVAKLPPELRLFKIVGRK